MAVHIDHIIYYVSMWFITDAIYTENKQGIWFVYLNGIAPRVFPFDVFCFALPLFVAFLPLRLFLISISFPFLSFLSRFLSLYQRNNTPKEHMVSGYGVCICKRKWFFFRKPTRTWISRVLYRKHSPFHHSLSLLFSVSFALFSFAKSEREPTYMYAMQNLSASSFVHLVSRPYTWIHTVCSFHFLHVQFSHHVQQAAQVRSNRAKLRESLCVLASTSHRMNPPCISRDISESIW